MSALAVAFVVFIFSLTSAIAGMAVYKCTPAQLSSMLPIMFGAFLTATVLGYVGGKATERGQGNATGGNSASQPDS